MRAGPQSDELFAAAIELVTYSSVSFKRTARRFSLCGHDAEDAYQRGLEILLTKAPTARRDELRPWLHTVIKHEALALRRQRERALSVDDETAGADAVPAPDREPDEAATSRERVHRTAEALGGLKPSEMQCMILKALGYSYDEIAARTGFSWTKVNRSLTEGRRRFFERFGEIAAGTACRRYQPLLSAACDGHAGVDDERLLKAHLASCAGCRAALREYRSAPVRLAELLPPALVLPLLDRASLWSRLNDWFTVTAGERVTAVGVKLQQSAEVASAQKAAAVVASTAAIAGGGAAVHHVNRPDRDRPSRTEQAGQRKGTAPAPKPGRSTLPSGDYVADAALDRTLAAPRRKRRNTSKEAAEFGFEGSGGPAPASGSEPGSSGTGSGAEVSAAVTGSSSEFSPVERGSATAKGAGGEFGP